MRFSLSFHCPFSSLPPHPAPSPHSAPGTFPLQIFATHGLVRTARVRVYAQLFRSVKGFDGGSTFRSAVRDTRLALCAVVDSRCFMRLFFFPPFFFSHSFISPSPSPPPPPYVLVSISTIVYPTSPSRTHVSLALCRRPLLSRLVKPTRQIIPSVDDCVSPDRPLTVSSRPSCTRRRSSDGMEGIEEGWKGWGG